jgi:2-oxoisovalerate dehydrogenase E2 component (dihydrolipoyl transacylase)
MATTITMPQLGETVTEGTVAQWLKKPGDAIEKYESFVEVSTDKVNAEVPSPVTGVLREIIAKEGETVPTGAPIAIIDEVGAATAPTPEPVAPPRSEVVAIPSSYGAPGGVATNGAHKNGSSNGNGVAYNAADVLRGVSPAVRRLAREHNVELTSVRGTGTNGRVTANDVINAANEGPAAAMAATIIATPTETTTHAPAAPSAPKPPIPESGKSTYTNPIPGTIVPLTQARRIIAERMVEAVRTTPHAWTMVEVDVTNVWAWRGKEKAAFERDNDVKLTLLPFVIRAVVESLGKFPLMNATFTPDGIRVNKEINIAIAVALADNLILPVVRNADSLSIKGIALASNALFDKARRGKLGADDMAHGTFTVNNTGANGSILSAPIIPAGQTGIITTEAVVKRAVVRADDSIAVRSMMNVCLSLDHRVVDGGIANGFLADLKKRLEAMGPTGSL